ncbi:MAG: carbohydrate-binding domain-containing protein, partial [Bacteroidaceae bacterium]|nr:carbohydrate-binding domain-containing protein [Bacteroidaceae bacterium]
MKRIISTVLLAAITLAASAQQYMRIWANGDNERVALQDLTFSNNGASVKVGETTYATAQIDSIRMVYVISVAFNGSTATVDLRNAPGVSYTTNGANVNIVSENTTDELEIELSGSSSNGSLTYTGGYKCKFYLQGLNLTSTTGAPLDIQCGKRVDLILVGGTTNTLTDATNGEQKACLYCKGHLEISGGGSLNVKGNTRHAIATKEYLQLKKSTGTITVTKAAGDAIHAGQYFQMNGGTLNLSGMTGDGIQAEMTNDPTEEYNGFV